MWAVGALGHWALIVGARGLGNVTCILGPGRGSLLGHMAPFLLRLSQAPADGGRGVTWVGSGWVCLAVLFWARLAGRAWPRPTDFVFPGVGSCLWAVVPLLSVSPFHLLGSRHPCGLGHTRWPSRGSARWGWEWLPPPPKAGHLLRLPRMGRPLLLDRLLGLLLPLLLHPSRRPLRLCPTLSLLPLSWELSLDLCLWAPGTSWWDTWWSREESPKAV